MQVRVSWLAFALALLAGGRAAAQPSAADRAAPPPQVAGVPIPPGQIDAAIAKLDDLTQAMLRRTGIPGIAVAVVQDGRTVYAKGFGVRRAGDSAPVDADTVFQLASVSKSIAATVVAKQVGLGVVAWDTPVVQHLPWFALQDPWITSHVTIGDMFAHRSGLPDHAGDDLEDLGYDRRQVLERLRVLPLHSFRDQYAYTNFGLTAAAESVAAAAGTPWESLSDSTLYQPLGMLSTSSRFADFMQRTDRAAGHVKVDGRYVPKYQRQPDAQSPAGGVSSSVRDMARWMSMVLQGGEFADKRIIAPEALLPALSAHMVTGPVSDIAARPGLYGYGVGVWIQPSGRVALTHSGAFALGAATDYLLIPSAGVGIVVLSNAAPIGAVEALCADFADLVQFGAVTRDWLHDYGAVIASMTAPIGALQGQAPPAHVTAPATLAAYAGAYVNDYYGPATIAERDGALVLTLGPTKTEFPLRHWDGSIFVFTPSGENAPERSLSAVTFTQRAADRAEAFTIELFAESGKNRFERRPD